MCSIISIVFFFISDNKGVMKYTVLWLPSRYVILKIYIVVIVILVVILFFRLVMGSILAAAEYEKKKLWWK